MSKIEAGRKLAEQPDRFFKEINSDKNEDKKFDIFAEYLGKGIFINKNEEPEHKQEQNTNSIFN